MQTSSTLNKSSSLPELKHPKRQKRREQRKIARSVVRRLYTCELKKIKLKNNSFMHKKPEDFSLDKQVKKLQKRRLLLIQPNSCFFLPKIERPEINNLCKLQESMRQAIYIPHLQDTHEDFDWKNKRISRNDEEDLSASCLSSANEEEYHKSIHQYREELNFVKTRIKVIMTTLPKLRENLEMWPKNCTHSINLSKKIEKLVLLLKTYESMEEKLKDAIRACENTLNVRQNSVYQPSSQDIRSRISVEVEEIDGDDANGKGYAETPTLILEGLVRNNLENIINVGFCSFPVSVFADSDEIIDGKLEITKEVLTLKSTKKENNLIFSGTFSIGNPELTIHLSDCKRCIFTFPDKSRFVIQCLSRTSRDMIAMVLHIFSAHTCLLHSKSLENFLTNIEKIEMSLELNEVLSQLHYLSNEKTILLEENKRVKKELSDMEKDLENTIESYKNTLDSSENLEEYDKVQSDLAKNIDKKNKLRKKLKKKEKEVLKLQKKLEEMKEFQQNYLLDLKQSQVMENEAKVEDFQRKLNEAHLELQQKNEKCMEGLKKITELNQIVYALDEKVQRVEKENLKLTQEIDDQSSFLQEFSQLKNQNEALLGQRNIMAKRIEVMNEELSEARAQKDSIEQSFSKKIAAVEDENRHLKEMLERNAEEKKSDECERLREEVLKYRQQCDNLAAQLSRVQAQVRRTK